MGASLIRSIGPAAPGGHGLRLAGVALAATVGGTHPAWSQAGGGQPALPKEVADTRIGDLRGQLQAYLPGVQVRTSGPAIQVTTSLGVDVGITDNALRVERPRRADVYTLISPSIQVSADTARVRANLSYTPQASIYAKTSSQTRFDQYGNASGLVTIVPDAIFLDLRGSVSQQSRTGGYGNNNTSLGTNTGTSQLNKDDQIQSTTFSVTPYAEHRFGGWGTARLGYSYAQTIQSGLSNQDAIRNQNNQFLNQNTVLANQVNNNAFFGATGNLTTQRERASFVTGENLGRINDIVVVEAVQYDGVGSYRGAHRNQVSNDVGYAVTRKITALAGFGYQDLKYSGQPGVRIQEPTWSFGGRFTPDPDSSLTITYGHRDGFNAAAVNGSYSPTARTRVFVTYSTGLTTDSEEQQNLLSSTNVGPGGLLVDSVTGAPVSGGSGGFGTQNSLYRLRRLSITGLLQLNRDSISVSFSNETRSNVNNVASTTGATIVPAGASGSGNTVSLAWQHELTPSLSSSASVSYSVDDNASVFGAGTTSGTTAGVSGNSGSQRTIQTTLGLSYVFTQTLTGNARYVFTDRTGATGQSQNNGLGFGSNAFGLGRAGQNLTENTVLVGLRKSF